MKLHSEKGTWTVEGQVLYTIEPDRPLTRAEMVSFYHGLPFGTLTYYLLQKPCAFARIVVLKPTGRHVIVPVSPHVKLIPDTEAT